MFFFISGWTLGESVNTTLDSLADICEAQEKAIVDATVEYEFSVVPLPNIEQAPKEGWAVLTGPEQYRWSGAAPFDKLSISSCDFSIMDENGNEWDVHISQSYNGQVAKKYQLDGWPQSDSEGIITNETNFKPIKSCTPIGYTVHHFAGDYFCLSQLLREKEKVTVVLDNQVRKVNDFNAVSVDIYAHIENKKILAQRVCFSPDHDFTPIEIEYFNGRTSVIKFDVLELKEINSGVWFPMKGCTSTSDPNEPKAIYQARRVVLNQGLDKEFFDIQFPAGTKVHDRINNTRYVVKENP